MNNKSKVRIMIGEVAGTINGLAGVLVAKESHLKLLREQERKLIEVSYLIDSNWEQTRT